jgi:hypothetical protein
MASIKDFPARGSLTGFTVVASSLDFKAVSSSVEELEAGF